MELNAKQIKKALECCKFGKDEAKCKECNWHPWIKPRCWRLLASNALTLINSQEQRIKELTQAHEMLSESYDHLEKTKDELLAERSRLTEENEAWQKALITEKENADKAYYELACEVEDLRAEKERLRVRVFEENHLRHQAEEMLAQGMSVVKADTVRKMQERLITEFRKDDRMNYYIRMTLEQVTKEMLEDKQ